MRCPICMRKGKKIFSSIVLDKYCVDYFQCPECAAVYTEKPYWMDEAYENAIVPEDTGVMQRGIVNGVITNRLIRRFIGPGTYLDYGGGYGIFARLMRDIGYDFYWYDKYAENLLARGFEFTRQKVRLVTAFEVMEHVEHPCSELEKMLRCADNILFSTVCYDKGRSYQNEEWWYYGQKNGQHIMFYSELTLKYLARKYHLNYYNLGLLHFYTKKKIPRFLIYILFRGIWCMPFMSMEWLWMMWKEKGSVGKDRAKLMGKG